MRPSARCGMPSCADVGHGAGRRLPGQLASLGPGDQSCEPRRRVRPPAAAAVPGRIDPESAPVLGGVVGPQSRPSTMLGWRLEPLVDPVVVGPRLVRVGLAEPGRARASPASGPGSPLGAAAEHEMSVTTSVPPATSAIARQPDRADQVGFVGDLWPRSAVAGVHRVPGRDQDCHAARAQRPDRPPDAVVVQALGDVIRARSGRRPGSRRTARSR